MGLFKGRAPRAALGGRLQGGMHPFLLVRGAVLDGN